MRIVKHPVSRRSRSSNGPSTAGQADDISRRVSRSLEPLLTRRLGDDGANEAVRTALREMKEELLAELRRSMEQVIGIDEPLVMEDSEPEPPSESATERRSSPITPEERAVILEALTDQVAAELQVLAAVPEDRRAEQVRAFCSRLVRTIWEQMEGPK